MVLGAQPLAGLIMDEIEIVPYDPDWPILYAAERERLSPLLSQVGLLEIEHIGSTAVPGLAAKPVIDIAATVTSLSIAREQGVPLIAALGYAFWSDNPDPSELFFVNGLPPRAPRRTHHLHISEAGPRFSDKIRFRDMLRADTETARRYAALKRDLAGHYRDDREAYTEAKTAFVTEALRRVWKGAST
jgi:GrpB-like predicted nucleotidyltransferase (UPF0157 family)